MKIANVHIKGFRNFVDESVDLDEKTLIVGGNDTGKSNLLYALRILFDPTLSARDLELTSSDFNVHAHAGAIEITARLEDIHEDCINSILGPAIKDHVAYIRYTLCKDGDYEFYTGHSDSEDDLVSCNGSRPYIKNLMLEYVGSSRDLATFLRRRQNKLLDVARSQRSDDQATEDDKSIESIQKDLTKLNDRISALHYISDSLKRVNLEMNELSVANEGYEARLIAGNTDADKLLDNLQLMYLHGDSPLVFGGDGRSNQLYFATWISEYLLNKQPEKVVIYAIEEPEAHLHPHQQRTLTNYLSNIVEGQVLITTHSPQIVERFGGGRILRLVGSDARSGSHVRGCSVDVDRAFEKMGYRLNAISSEVFFSSGVLLVEGPSERILYSALAHALDEDIDRCNLSVLSVDGVGFEPYVRACVSLGIPFVVRTDNDVFGIGKKSRRRLAGVQRLADIATEFISDEELHNLIASEKDNLSWDALDTIPAKASEAASKLVPALRQHGLYLSKAQDLEHDLANGPLAELLEKHFEVASPDEVVKTMQKRKAEMMYSFIGSNPDLRVLSCDPIVEPLYRIVRRIKGAWLEF